MAIKKKRAPAKTYSKKVGRWRCECKGRTVVCAGAKHSYKSAPAALTAYKKINSVKSVENFVKRYGKKATCVVVCGMKKTASKRPARRKVTKRNPSNMQRTLRRYGYL